MSNPKVLKFALNFERLNTDNPIIEQQKILIECEWLQRLFICKWSRPTKNGTRGTFTECTEDEAIGRINLLKIEAEKIGKEHRK